jgi:hypothetical protein
MLSHSGESRNPGNTFWTPAFAGVTAFVAYCEIVDIEQ